MSIFVPSVGMFFPTLQPSRDPLIVIILAQPMYLDAVVAILELRCSSKIARSRRSCTLLLIAEGMSGKTVSDELDEVEMIAWRDGPKFEKDCLLCLSGA